MKIPTEQENQEQFAQAKRDELVNKVENAAGYDSIFELVKQVVRSETGKHRAGLSLVLSDMPNVIGAYHPVGSNLIVLNRSLIQDMKNFVENRELNSFVFMVLMHEYVHSLGLYDELEVRQLVHKICKNALGETHISARMASGNWIEMYPQLAGRHNGPSSKPEYVQKFDTGSAPYLG